MKEGLWCMVSKHNGPENCFLFWSILRNHISAECTLGNCVFIYSKKKKKNTQYTTKNKINNKSSVKLHLSKRKGDYKYACSVLQSSPTICDPMDSSLPSSSLHGILLGRNAGVGSYFLFHGISPIQGLNPSFLHCREIPYHWATWGAK